MGKVIDLDERRQVKALHQALLGSMARLIRLTRRYGRTMAELQRDAPDRRPEPDLQDPASPPPNKLAPDR